ncbi:radical SAM protein [Nocardia sp. NPDC051321]|uniref:radical SAM protein n=1 Tax=Nocardia sp. NPDC051321 TaxID=3364323 RepID=UPI0037A93A36
MIREKQHPAPDTPLIVLLKLAGEQCNINCTYCFERRKPYEGSARFDGDLTEKALKTFAGHPVRVILHGGEPLLVGKRRMAEILRSIYASEVDVRGVGIQTNGLLLDPEWIGLFDEYFPELDWGLSFDGPGQANSNRRDHSDRETHDGAVRALKILADHGKRPGVISVINSAHVDVSPVEFFEPFHRVRDVISGLSLVPCFDFTVKPRIWNSQSGARILQMMSVNGPEWAVSPEFYSQYVVSVMREWIARGDWRHYSLEPVVNVVGNITGNSRIARSTTFGFADENHVVTVYPNGRMGPHDRIENGQVGVMDLSPDPSSIDRLLENTRTTHAAEWKDLLERCNGCSYWEFCRGGELHERREMRKSDREDEYCASRMEIIDAVRSEIE